MVEARSPLPRSIPLAAPTRRSVLHHLAAIGGTGLVMAGLDAFGISIASAQTAPPALTGSGTGKRVVILGAGVGGMTAAHELSKLGYACQVIEARSFAGGRCQTARAGFSLTELGGEAQTCEFDDGQYINHGPWRIPYNHQSTLHYTKEFQVPLEVMINDNDASYVFFESGSGPLKGKTVRRAQVAADMRGQTAELLAKAVRKGTLDDPIRSRMPSSPKHAMTTPCPRLSAACRPIELHDGAVPDRRSGPGPSHRTWRQAEPQPGAMGMLTRRTPAGCGASWRRPGPRAGMG